MPERPAADLRNGEVGNAVDEDETDLTNDDGCPATGGDHAARLHSLWRFDGDRVGSTRFESNGFLAPENVTEPGLHTIEVDLAVAPHGDALGAWVRWNGTKYDLWSRRFAAGATWDPPEHLDVDVPVSASDPRVALGSAGEAVIAWHTIAWHTPEEGASTLTIWARVASPGMSWAAPHPLREWIGDGGGVSVPTYEVAAGSGRAAVLVEDPDAPDALWGFVHGSQGGWSGGFDLATEVAPEESVLLGRRSVVATEDGFAVIWRQSGDIDTVWSAFHDGEAAWQTLPVPADAPGFDPSLVALAGGDVLAAWHRIDTLETNRYVRGAGWAPPTMVAEGFITIETFALAANGTGAALLVWLQDDRTLFGSRFATAAE